MTTIRTGPVPPRRQVEHEDTPIDHAELCIRIMERFFDAAGAHPNLQGIDVYDDLFPLYTDVLQEELEPYAFDLAYRLFSGNDVVRKWRREKDRRLDPRRERHE